MNWLFMSLVLSCDDHDSHRCTSGVRPCSKGIRICLLCSVANRQGLMVLRFVIMTLKVEHLGVAPHTNTLQMWRPWLSSENTAGTGERCQYVLCSAH